MGQPTLFVNKSATIGATSTANQTLATHSSGLKNPDGSAGNGGVLDRLFFYNGDSILHDVSSFLVPAGGSVASSTLIDRIQIPSKQTYLFQGPKYASSGAAYAFQVAEAASSSGGVWGTIDYHEMS